jgi:hypothetical protein
VNHRELKKTAMRKRAGTGYYLTQTNPRAIKAGQTSDRQCVSWRLVTASRARACKAGQILDADSNSTFRFFLQDEYSMRQFESKLAAELFCGKRSEE